MDDYKIIVNNIKVKEKIFMIWDVKEVFKIIAVYFSLYILLFYLSDLLRIFISLMIALLSGVFYITIPQMNQSLSTIIHKVIKDFREPSYLYFIPRSNYDGL